MSDESKKAPETVASPLSEERFKNFQSEVDRKLSNTNSQLQALLGEMQKARTAYAPSSTKHVSVFEDEEAYAQRIKAEASREIEAKLEAKQAAQNRYQQVIGKIVADYPEASDESTPLMIRAKEIYASYSDDERASPVTMKAAVTEAASELGIRPKSKRAASSTEDSFVMGASSSPSSTSKRSVNTEKVNAAIDFARLMGLDEKAQERIKAKVSKK